MGRKAKPEYKLFCSIDGLKYIVSQHHSDGQWVFEGNYYQYKIKNKTNISFYPSTRALLFQSESSTSTLKESVIATAIQERVLK